MRRVAVVRRASYVFEIPSASFLVLGTLYEVLRCSATWGTLAESSACCPLITPLRLRVLKPIVRFVGRYLNNASHFAGLFSALYLALLLCTPWLIRESTLLLPSSASVSAQETSGAASAAVEVLRTALHARH